MRILRLTNSDDLRPVAYENERAHRIVERAFEAETGEHVETVLRAIWPTPELPDLIEEWIERFEPDAVFMKVSAYWFTYESVPLKVQRSHLGPLGRGVARAGFRTAESPIGETSFFHAARRFSRRVVGSAVYFTPEQVIDCASACLRRIAQAEQALVLVRGPIISEAGGVTARVERRAELRRRQVHEALRALCAELRIHYTGCSEAPSFRESARYRGPDRMHLNADGHRWVGEEESRALLAAWRRLHGADEPLYLESEALT